MLFQSPSANATIDI